MKIVVLLSLLALGCAAPQFAGGRRFQFNPPPRPFQPVQQFRPVPTPQPYYNRPVATIRDFREDHGNGHFRYEFETENGINVNAVGTPGSRGQSNIAGGFSFPFPEGGSAQLTYVADEFGYRPQSPLIPTPPPLPAHAIEQIRVAEEQRARGIRWD
ncbi:cuticle protein AM1199-like [Palaemon carinicauda]|uniref:cuticle protein AM1199-like n=1 Tax=Palaemon carinicauda TaxID=392227 RepID=UPI0035B5AC64